MLAHFPFLEAALSSCTMQFSANQICWPVLLFCTDIPGMLPLDGYFRGGLWDWNSKVVLGFTEWGHDSILSADCAKLGQTEELDILQ